MFSDPRPPAHTCACCGQGVALENRLTVRVEAPLLDLCNAAYAAAAAAGHPQVDVAHLIAILVEAPEAMAAFRQNELDPAALTSAAHRWLGRLPRRHDDEAVTASAELRSLLTRAEQHAAGDARTHASVADVVVVLARLTGTSRAQWSAAAAPAASNASSLQSRLTTAPPSGVNASPAAHAHPSRRGGNGEDSATLAALLARLDRQEAELAGLRAALQQRSAPRARTHSTAGTRVASRAQIFEAGYHTLSTRSTPDRVFLRLSLRRRRQQNRRRRTTTGEREGMSATFRAGFSGETMSPRFATPQRARSQSMMATSDAHTTGLSRHRDRSANSGDGEGEATGASAKRFYLAPGDHIERAPSIGPKTAGRLIDAGIATVRDLLAADPDALCASVRAKFITAERIRDWQAQARLVCTVPFLRGTHAQLLVGAGYREIDRIRATDPPLLCADILKFATTRDGQSVLRSGEPPDMERILRWIENAAGAEPARAAA